MATINLLVAATLSMFQAYIRGSVDHLPENFEMELEHSSLTDGSSTLQIGFHGGRAAHVSEYSTCLTWFS